MEKDLFQEDLKKAQRICEELRSGIDVSFNKLVKENNNLFKAYAKRRLYQPEIVDEVLNDFWLSLIKKETICKYQGKDGSSLNNYLFKILSYQIIDRNRKIPPKTIPREDISCVPSENTPESQLIASEKQSILNEALLTLGSISPEDESLIQMYLDGKDYKEMAKTLLSGKKIDDEILQRKSDAIRKQFTRPKTGSKAKFKRIVERIIQQKGLTLKDFQE